MVLQLKPGPDKNYVKPMGEGYAPGDVDEKLGSNVTLSLRRIETQLETDFSFGKKAKREKMKKEGFEMEEGAAWTKKSGKNPSGGLNEKGRKSYERENPGSDLKRPLKKLVTREEPFCKNERYEEKVDFSKNNK